jgi:DNA-binding transcriptional ArsR family regulator
MGNDLQSWPNVNVIRIEFTAEDIARTRVTSTLGPFAETLLGLGSLRMSRRDRIAAPWRRHSDRLTSELADFLTPRGRVQLDLFTLTGQATEFAAGADALLAAPSPALAAEIQVTHCLELTEPPWLRGIGRAELPARRRMVDVIDRAHRRLVEPYWPAMEALLDAERARLQRLLADGGVDRLLSEFHPTARWKSGVLELPTAGRWTLVPLTSRLRGRGLVLVPSVLCPAPVPFFPYDAGQPAVVLYPAAADPATQARLWGTDRRNGSSALGTLLGRTRAAALEVIADGCTTTELARRLGVSPGNASQHASALRDAGLVTSQRDRNRMLHTVTRLGAELLGSS